MTNETTSQDGDVFSWLDTAISAREDVARAADAINPSPWTAGSAEDASVTHIALNDPESVLRRCAADRKLLTLHNTPGNVFPDGSYMDDNRWCVGCGYGNDGEPLTPDVNDCPTLHALALGYGWTEGKR